MDARERLGYMWEDFLSRPERVRFARTAGVVLAAALLIGLAFLLSRGKAQPARRPKESRQETVAAAAPAPNVRDAFSYAKEAEERLRADPRFSRVYLVPSAATADQKHSKVVVMGEVGSTQAFNDLQREMIKNGAPVSLEWQVAVPPGK